MDLAGKVAIVTGSGRGLGLAYAERLATNGAAVVVNDVTEEVAEAAADHVRVAGGKATAVTAAASAGTAAPPIGACTIGTSIPNRSQTGVRTRLRLCLTTMPARAMAGVRPLTMARRDISPAHGVWTVADAGMA